MPSHTALSEAVHRGASDRKPKAVVWTAEGEALCSECRSDAGYDPSVGCRWGPVFISYMSAHYHIQGLLEEKYFLIKKKSARAGEMAMDTLGQSFEDRHKPVLFTKYKHEVPAI